MSARKSSRRPKADRDQTTNSLPRSPVTGKGKRDSFYISSRGLALSPPRCREASAIFNHSSSTEEVGLKTRCGESNKLCPVADRRNILLFHSIDPSLFGGTLAKLNSKTMYKLNPKRASFAHSRNDEGTFDLICPRCFQTIAQCAREPDLRNAEDSHVCNPSVVDTIAS